MLESVVMALLIMGGDSDLGKHFIDAAEEHGVPVEVLLGVAKLESDFKPRVRSSAGACCYLQLLGGKYGNPSCKKLEENDRLCIMTGAKEIGDLFKKHKDMEKALCHYHGGKCWPKSTYPSVALWWAGFARAIMEREPAGYWDCNIVIEEFGIDRNLRAPVWKIPLKNSPRSNINNYSKEVQKKTLLQLKYQSCAEQAGLEWNGKFSCPRNRKDYPCVTSGRKTKCEWQEGI